MAVPEPPPAAKPSIDLDTPSHAPSTHEQPTVNDHTPHEYPSMGRTWIAMLSLYICMFLIALDKTIIATAVPRITDDFNALSDIGWYIASYMLTTCAFQLLWGRIYTFYPARGTFVVAVVIFEVGSALCGAAPNSTAFILGRAIAGAGTAGIQNGAIVVMMQTVPLEKRPVFQGLIGAVFGVASVVGPLLGGALTQRASWRWCFYLNLPCGGFAVAVLLLVLRIPAQKNREKFTPKQQFWKLDPLGMALFLPSVVCLLLALQWGGTTYAWSSWRIILLFVLFPILLVLFFVTQIRNPENASLPMRILRQRSIASGFFFTSMSFASMLSISYYIPLFFQALKNFSPVNSGLATLPIILGLVIASILAGGLVQRLGFPKPFMILSTILMSVGAGLITTWPVSVGSSIWIGYQFLYGFGNGIGMQQPIMTAQIVLPRPDVPTGIALLMFGQNLGGAVFVAVAQSVFTDTLAEQLTKIPGMRLSKQQIVQLGATTLRSMVPEGMMEVFLEGYRLAIRNTFYVATALSCVTLIGAVLIEWRSVKEGEKTNVSAKQAPKEGGEKEAV